MILHPAPQITAGSSSPSPLRVDDPVVPPLPGSTGNGFVSGALFPLVASPGGMRRPHILRSVEELRVICRVFRAVGCFGMRRYGSPVRCGFGTECHGTARLKWCAMFRFVSLCSGPCFALGRLHCPGFFLRVGGVLRARLRDHGPQGSAFSRLCVPLMSRYGAYLPGSYRRHPRFYFSFVLWCSAVGSPCLHGWL